ncbi:MAG TPA: selenium cofactor biosynthesis protein YqeC [Bacillota bacterium]|nr:selenium cofactor biosynthesis protein YqeC [Bacillota bacterium]
MESLYSQVNIDKWKKVMICLVGAGGKTSAMFRLAKELSTEGKKVLVTTTTAIYYPSESQNAQTVIADLLLPDLFKSIRSGITVYGRALSKEGKLLGVDPEYLDALFLKGIFDYIIVEGDGSKGRSLKAPGEHEPVIPSLASKVLGLIGLDCVGKKVCPENVHRPEMFCNITGCREGDIIDADMIGRLIAHEEGLFKAVPSRAERYVVLNKADGEKEWSAAGKIIQRLSDMGYEPDGIVVTKLRM